MACTDLIDRLRICAAARFLGHASPATEPTPPVSGDSTSPAAPPASASSLPDAPVQSVEHPATDPSRQQPKRILGVMPNFRAVSPGTTPPPPTFKQSLTLARQDSFDYSSYIFEGITSDLAYGTDAHPQLARIPALIGHTTGGALSISRTVITG